MSKILKLVTDTMMGSIEVK